MTTTVDTTVSQLIINTIPKELFASITPSSTELYLTDEVISAQDVEDALGYTPESTSNRVTTITSASTDTTYPSAKAVYNGLQAIETLANGKVSKFTATCPALTSTSSKCSWTISNTLGVKEVQTHVYEASTYGEVLANIKTSTSNIVVELFSDTNISAGSYEAVIEG